MKILKIVIAFPCVVVLAILGLCAIIPAFFIGLAIDKDLMPMN